MMVAIRLMCPVCLCLLGTRGYYLNDRCSEYKKMNGYAATIQPFPRRPQFPRPFPPKR
jgi:hypothetical protein